MNIMRMAFNSTVHFAHLYRRYILIVSAGILAIPSIVYGDKKKNFATLWEERVKNTIAIIGIINVTFCIMKIHNPTRDKYTNTTETEGDIISKTITYFKNSITNDYLSTFKFIFTYIYIIIIAFTLLSLIRINKHTLTLILRIVKKYN